MTQTDFKPIFDYLDKHLGDFRGEVNERFTTLENKVDSLQTSVDNLAHQVLSFQQEMAIMTMRVGRMEAWIQSASQKIGVPYQVLS